MCLLVVTGIHDGMCARLKDYNLQIVLNLLIDMHRKVLYLISGQRQTRARQTQRRSAFVLSGPRDAAGSDCIAASLFYYPALHEHSYDTTSMWPERPSENC